MEIVLEELQNLHLHCLSDEWVQNAYCSEFLEFGDFPPDYDDAVESLDTRKVFQSIIKAFDEWVVLDLSGIEDKSWATLSHNVPHQKLLALIAYYIDYGSKNVLTKEYRNNAIQASRLYFKLLSVSGFKAYHIYHSQLFAQSLTCLGFPNVMCEHENNYFNSKELAKEVNSVIKNLQYFVLDLHPIIETLHLNPNDINFEDVLSNLVDITGGAFVKLNIDKIELASISKVIYKIIDILLCNSDKEPNQNAIQILFKCLLPKLVSASVDSRNANNLARASYVKYTGLLLNKYGKAALSEFTTLLQHLCYTLDGLEKAEVRTARVSLVLSLMSLLPKKIHYKTVKWLLDLSATSKVLHRQIALELLSKLLINDFEETEPTNVLQASKLPEPPQPISQQDQEISINTGESINETNTELVDDSKMINNEDDSCRELTSQQEDDVTEEEPPGRLSDGQHSVPRADVLRAVYERARDASSAVRARALLVLAECVHSERPSLRAAINELDSAGQRANSGDECDDTSPVGERIVGQVGRVMAAAAQCVCDERAAVRRAAVSLVHRHLSGCASPAQSDLAILVGLCRDASIIVRTAAITALGDLVVHRPTGPVLDAFLSGPLHQLSDPEAKVQDHVVSIVRQNIFDRLQRYSADEDPLPWLILAGITKHNKRRLLQRACDLLHKATNCISIRLVDIISTHLGAVADSGDRDLYALVLLSSVARHVDYADISFVIEHYYKISDDDQTLDCRVMPLTLEVLGAWCGRAGGAARAALRDHLVRRLASATDIGCRTASAQLAAMLDPDNLQWATDLMQISERRALSGTSDVCEWLRAADLSLVAPTPPNAALLRLFLNALAKPPPEWSDVECGAAVAGVGRLCVRGRGAASDAAPALAALLHASDRPLPARINALLALTDICTRYTCIVEPLMDSVCGCVGREAPAPLRRAAARALTRLLLAGYLRLRTPLYYRFCALLADDDHDVREPAEYYVTSCLTTDAIYHHFVECVLYYNKEDIVESISFDARQLIYDVMLQRMSLVQKLNIQCRLAREILQHCADVLDEGYAELPPALQAALLDTITLLCGPRMKLPKKPQNNADPADMEDLHERITTNIVSHKMKRQVAEVLVPAVLRLYARLRAGGGQVAAYLVRIATDLLHDYRAEMEELIEHDEELVERVRHFERTIGAEPTFGNARNLVTTSAPPDPATPRAPRTPRTPRRRRPAPPHLHYTPTNKKALRMT